MLHAVDLGILADDLTGACDAAAAFAPYVGPVQVVIEPRAAAQRAAAAGTAASAVMVLNTQSRLLSPGRSRNRVQRIVRNLAGRTVLYKKTDSVLRGPAGAELEGMARVFPRHQIFVIPSVPAMGKTMKGGCLFEGGIPAHQTAYGKDPLSPLLTNDVRQILQSTGTIDFEVVDAETEEDIQRGVERALARGNVILAGSVGLADALARSLERHATPPGGARKQSRILFLCGSQYDVAREQMRRAAQDYGETIIDAAMRGGAKVALERSRTSPVIFVKIETGQITTRAQALRTLPSLFRSAKRIILSYAPDALGIIGGETAYRILRMLRTTRLQVTGREQAGMSYGRIVDGELSGCSFVTKGGSVGSPEACRLMVGRLRQ